MRDNFDESVRRVFAEEGGYTNDPHDPGGATNWGITIADARRYWKRNASREDVRGMPKTAAKKIYRDRYWNAMRCDELPRGLDFAVLDYGVNSGVSRAIKVLERLVGLPQDGKCDDTLIRSVARADAKDLIAKLCDERLKFLRGLRNWRYFGKGWGGRVARVRFAALSMANDKLLPPPKPVQQTEKKTESPKATPPVETKDLAKSKTLWAALSGIVTAISGAIWQAVGDNPASVAIVCAFIVVALLLFVGRERIKKIVADKMS